MKKGEGRFFERGGAISGTVSLFIVSYLRFRPTSSHGESTSFIMRHSPHSPFQNHDIISSAKLTHDPQHFFLYFSQFSPLLPLLPFLFLFLFLFLFCTEFLCSSVGQLINRCLLFWAFGSVFLSLPLPICL